MATPRLENPQITAGYNSIFSKGRDVTYRTAHCRVSKLWGKASNYPCIKCGEPAQEWAYDGTDPLEKDHLYRDKYLMKYSPDPEFYYPACIPCHRAADLSKDFCVNGHKMTEENIYRFSTRPNNRRCRKCTAAIQRRIYLRRKARMSLDC